MILERLEPKNSKKVAVCAPGRPFEVAKGAFSAPGFDILTEEQVTSWKNKSIAHRKIRADVANSRELLPTARPRGAAKAP